MWRIAAAGTVLTIASSVLVSGCAVQCGSNPEKLAALRRGMSYEETTRIMGCPGSLVSTYAPDSGEASTVEWDGPGSVFFMRTQIDFLDGRLLFFTTEPRGGL